MDLFLDKSLKKIRVAFKFTGLNIDAETRSTIQNFLTLCRFLWINTDALCAIWWLLFGGLMSGSINFTELTYVAPCLTFIILGDIKALFLFLNERKVHTLIDNLRELEFKSKIFARTLGGDHCQRENMIEPETKFLNTIINLLKTINCMLFVTFHLTPLILIAVKYYNKGELELMLPFMDIYPFEALTFRYWPLAYLHQMGTAGITLATVSGSDFFFFTCCIHIKIQFKLLQHQFQELIANRSVSQVPTDQEPLRAKFHELVKWHQKIISSANMLEGIYSKSTLSNFLISSLTICVTGFNVTTDDKALALPSILFLSVGMSQVFFLCFFGDILMVSSMAVADSLYNSRWYLSDAVMGRYVLLVLARSQKPCKVTAAGFADANLKAYMKIMSTAWSYFALLQTMYSSHK